MKCTIGALKGCSAQPAFGLRLDRKGTMKCIPVNVLDSSNDQGKAVPDSIIERMSSQAREANTVLILSPCRGFQAFGKLKATRIANNASYSMRGPLQ